MKFKVISFDMFQTLVDVNARKYAVWEDILQECYTKKKAEELWQETLRGFADYSGDPFIPMYQKYSVCYRELFKKYNITMGVEQAVDILFREHGKAVVYPDTKDFFAQLNPQYRIWISSDTDRNMIMPLLQLFKHELAFISEEIGAYKQNEQGRFFRHMLEKTGCKPDEILHVGDGLSDIIGAKKVGITACWINRDNREWTYSIKPDYTIRSLVELNGIL